MPLIKPNNRRRAPQAFAITLLTCGLLGAHVSLSAEPMANTGSASSVPAQPNNPQSTVHDGPRQVPKDPNQQGGRFSGRFYSGALFMLVDGPFAGFGKSPQKPFKLFRSGHQEATAAGLKPE